MTARIDITIATRSVGDGAQRAASEQAKLQAQVNQTINAYDRAEKALRRADQQYQANQRSAQALAQSEIRAATAAGEYGRALNLVQAQLDQTASGTKRYNDLLAQQSRISKQAAAGTKEAGGALGGLTSSLGGVVKGYIGLQAAGAAYDFAKQGAQIRGTTESFNNLAASIGSTGPVLLNSLRAASQGYVSDAELMAGANKAILLGGQELAGSLPKLLQIATAASKAGLGDVGFLYESLVTGISRGSTEILDNIGLTIKVGDVNAAYASKLGKTVDQLSATEKQQALLNDVVAKGDKFIKDIGGSADETAGSLARAETQLKNFIDQMKVAAAKGAGETVGFLQDMANTINSIIDGNFAGAGSGADSVVASAIGGPTNQSFDEYIAVMTQYNQLQAAVSREEYTLAQALYATSGNALQAAGQARELNLALGELRTGGDLSAEAFTRLNARALEIAQISPAAAAGVIQLARAFDEGNINNTQLVVGLAALAVEQEHATAMAAQAQAEQNRLNGAVLAVQGTVTATTPTILDMANATQAEIDASIRASIEQNNLALATQATRVEAINAIDAYFNQAKGLDAVALAALNAQNQLAGLAVSSAQKQVDQRFGGATRLPPEVRQQYVEEAAKALVDPAGTKAQFDQQAKAIEQGGQDRTRRYQEAQRSYEQAQKAAASAQKKTATAAAKDQAAIERERQQEAEAKAKALYELMTAEEQLVEQERRSKDMALPESARLEALVKVRDLEKEIRDERIKGIKDVIVAEKGRVDDVQARILEEQDRRRAQSVLSSGTTSADQKALAAARLQEIDIDRRSRAVDIAEKSGVIPAGFGAVPSDIPQRVLPGPVAPGAAGAAGGGGAGAQQMINLHMTVLLDGKEIGMAMGDVSVDQVGIKLRLARAMAKAGGTV